MGPFFPIQPHMDYAFTRVYKSWVINICTKGSIFNIGIQKILKYTFALFISFFYI